MSIFTLCQGKKIDDDLKMCKSILSSLNYYESFYKSGLNTAVMEVLLEPFSLAWQRRRKSTLLPFLAKKGTVKAIPVSSWPTVLVLLQLSAPGILNSRNSSQVYNLLHIWEIWFGPRWKSHGYLQTSLEWFSGSNLLLSFEKRK